MGREKLVVEQCSLVVVLAFLLVLCAPGAMSRVRSNMGFLSLTRILVDNWSMGDSVRALPASEAIHSSEIDISLPRENFQSAIRLNHHNSSANVGLIVASLFDEGLDAPKIITNYGTEINSNTSQRAAFWLGFYFYNEVGSQREAIQHWQVAQAGAYLRTLGTSLVRQGSTYCSEATRLLELAVMIDPFDADGMFELGNAFRCERQSGSAAATYRAAAGLYPNTSARRFLALGHAAYLSQEWADALAAYNQVTRLSSVDRYDLLSAYQWLDRVCASGMGDWECAADAVRATFNLISGDPWPYWRMGEIAVARGDIAEAARWYREASSLPGHQVEARQRLARFWVSVGEQALGDERWQDAQQSFRKAVEISPDLAEAYVGLGRVAFWGRGERSQAEDYLATALQIDSQNDNAVIWLARLYREEMEISESLDLLQALVRRKPHNAEAWAQMGLTFYTIDDFEGAITYLEEATSLRDDIPWYYLALGDAYREAGRPNAAIQAYRRASEVAPGWTAPAERILDLEVRNQE